MEQAVDAIAALHYDAENTEFTGDEMKCLGSLESALQSGLKPQRKVSQDTVLVLHPCPSHWVGHGAHGCHQWVISPFCPTMWSPGFKVLCVVNASPLQKRASQVSLLNLKARSLSLSGSVLEQSFSVCSESPVLDFEVPHLTLYCRNIFIEWRCGPFKSQFALLLGFERF